MTQIRISDAADFLGVSPDTVRRLVAAGKLERGTSDSGPMTVDGRSLASYAKSERSAVQPESPVHRSARNRFVGIVTDITSDLVMSQVEIQCGPYRVVSLISTESVRELDLEVGSVAAAVVKATNVIIETTDKD
ncbi:MAG: TOBE domain-containing protein [Actinomycetales bacterium]|nr:TOBE domain-containing protein [Actinomycetales bacterium]